MPLDSAVVLKYPLPPLDPVDDGPRSASPSASVASARGSLAGRNEMDQFQADSRQQCTNGCEPGLTDPSHRSLEAQRDSAQLKGQHRHRHDGRRRRGAVTGLVLAILNRPHRVLPNVEAQPMPGGASASVGWSF